MADPAVRVEGIREFRRALRRTSPAVDREFRAELKDAARGIAADASAHAVKRTGAYARSIRPYVSGARVSVGSRLPQAGVLHWGGTIRPRGVPIVFPARPVVSEAVDRHADRITDAIGGAVERAARKAGWKT